MRHTFQINDDPVLLNTASGTYQTGRDPFQNSGERAKLVNKKPVMEHFKTT